MGSFHRDKWPRLGVEGEGGEGRGRDPLDGVRCSGREVTRRSLGPAVWLADATGDGEAARLRLAGLR